VNYWKVILATVVIFGTGVLTGGLLVDVVQRDLFAALHHSSQAGNFGNRPAIANPNATNRNSGSSDARAVAVGSTRPSDFLNHRLGLVQKMDSALKLTPAQHDAIDRLITEGQTQINKVMENTFQSVRDALTPEQRKKYEEMLKQFHQQAHPVASPNTNALPPPAHPPEIVPVNTNASVI
jgi:Spy/CpxP family protein refolding chaperone